MQDPRRRRESASTVVHPIGPGRHGLVPGPIGTSFEDDRRYFAETAKFQSIANTQKGIVLWYEGNISHARNRLSACTKVQYPSIVTTFPPILRDLASPMGAAVQSSRHPDRTVRRNRRRPALLIGPAANIPPSQPPQIQLCATGFRRPRRCCGGRPRGNGPIPAAPRDPGRGLDPDTGLAGKRYPGASAGAAWPGRQGGIIGCVPRRASRIENSRMFGAVSRSHRYCTS